MYSKMGTCTLHTKKLKLNILKFNLEMYSKMSTYTLYIKSFHVWVLYILKNMSTFVSMHTHLWLSVCTKKWIHAFLKFKS